jgi:hypothetical protein
MSANYSGGEFAVTLSSGHKQCKFWPEYLPEDPRIVFIIERSKNGNIVVYRSVLDSTGKHLNPSSPFHGEWWTNGWTSSPYREELGFFEKKMAYGWTFTKDEDAYIVSVVSLPQRKMRLTIDGVVCEINGKKCRLWKLYVNTTEGWGTPTVNYVDLYGFEVEDSNKQQVERIKP